MLGGHIHEIQFKAYSETKSLFKAHLIDARSEDIYIYKVYKDLTSHILYFPHFTDVWVNLLARPVLFPLPV